MSTRPQTRRAAARNVSLQAANERARRQRRAYGARTSVAARFLMLWIAAVLATAAAFVVHLSMRFETVRLGYEVGAARREQRRLIEQRRLLALEAATLRQSPRVETIARGVLEMEPPSADRVVPITPRRGSRRTAGRVR